MPALPVTRKKTPTRADGENNAAKEFLAEAFAAFHRRSWIARKVVQPPAVRSVAAAIQAERTNRELSRSVEKNARMREYLSRIVESLPCGVVVLDEASNIRVANPMSRRLSGSGKRELRNGGPIAPDDLRELLCELRQQGSGSKREWRHENSDGIHWIGISCAALSGEPADTESVFILRDTTEQKRLAEARESIGANGQLTTADGSQVLGNPAVNGVITPGPSPVPLSISQGATSPPQATKNVSTTLNLDSDSAVGATFNTSLTGHDALGATRVLTLTFTKTAANTWTYNMTVRGADLGGGNTAVDQQWNADIQWRGRIDDACREGRQHSDRGAGGWGIGPDICVRFV